MSNSITDTTSTAYAATDTTTNSAATKGSSEISKDAFLQLLVAQIKNQDPLNPTDGVQFLTQLAQFSQLEQTMGIRDDLKTLTSAVEAGKSTDTQNTTGETSGV